MSISYYLNFYFVRVRVLLGFIMGLAILSPLSGQTMSLPVERTVMDNGLILLVLQQPTIPIVNVRVMIKAGALFDPEDKPGVANLVADLLDEGTSRRSSVEIADAIDFIGGRLNTTGGSDWATISLGILKEDFKVGIDLLSDILLHPSFSKNELKRRRQEILGELAAEKDQPGVVGRRAFNKLVFGKHPYHRPIQGTEESLLKIKRSDLLEFYEKYYRPNNTVIAIVGDVSAAEAKDIMVQHFRKWASSPIQATLIPEAPRLEKKVIKLIDRNITQANIILGHIGITRQNPDYYTVLVMNYILGGGGFSSRLLTEIRDNQGLAYSIHSRFGASMEPGSFVAKLQTKNSSAQQAIQAVIAEIRRIRENPVSDQEIEEAKAFLTGSFPLQMDTSSEIATLLTQVEFFELGQDYFEDFIERIQAVSKEDVQRAAQKYLFPDRYVLVVVANQKDADIKIAGDETLTKTTK